MVVCDDISVGTDDNARTETNLLLFGLLSGLLLLAAALLRSEEEVEERVVVEIASAILLLAARLGSGEAFYRDNTVDGLFGCADEFLLRNEAGIALGRSLRRVAGGIAY